MAELPFSTQLLMILMQALVGYCDATIVVENRDEECRHAAGWQPGRPRREVGILASACCPPSYREHSHLPHDLIAIVQVIGECSTHFYAYT